jgi:aminopeptidase YwaD
MADRLALRASEHLEALCVAITDRSVGSAGNQASTAWFEGVMRELGWRTERQEFTCLDWEGRAASLRSGTREWDLRPGPYGLACRVEGPLRVVSTLHELRGVDAAAAVLLVRGELCASQLMPKGFPFYNPDSHREIVALLEGSGALAVVAATGVDPWMAGGERPFPLIEDGDFELPTAFTDDEAGLEALEGQRVELVVDSRRWMSTGWNPVARLGSGPRVVVCAHIDAKKGSPGAVDNGGGAVILLLLAELLRSHSGAPEVEIVAFNGEDYFATPGQLRWLELDRGEVSLVINIDGVGYVGGETAWSVYGVSDAVEGVVREAFAALVEGPRWVQGDHSIFVQRGVPAVALTTTAFEEAWTAITHTKRDTVDQVDPAALVRAAQSIARVLERVCEVERQA